MKELFNNIVWLILDKLLLVLMNFIIVIKIANYYGAERYGMYEYVFSIVSILAIVLTLVDSRVTKGYYNDEKYNHGGIIFNVTVLKVILSIFLLILGYIVCIYTSQGLIYNNIFLYLLLSVVFLNISFGFENYFEFYLKSRYIVISTNVARAICLLIQLIAVLLEFNISTMALILCISNFIRAIMIYIIFRKNNYKLEFIIYKQLMKKILTESLPLCISTTAYIIYSKSDQIMIGNFLSNYEVGLYAISYKLYNLVVLFISPIQISVYPSMLKKYSKNKLDYYNDYRNISSLMTWGSILIMTICIVILPVFFRFFLSSEYVKSLDIFRVQVFGTIFMYNAILRSSHLTLIKKGSIMMMGTILACIINILLNVVLITSIGTIGAAIATVITQILSLLVVNLVFKESRIIFKLQLQAFNPYYMYDFFNTTVRNLKKKGYSLED